MKQSQQPQAAQAVAVAVARLGLVMSGFVANPNRVQVA